MWRGALTQTKSVTMHESMIGITLGLAAIAMANTIAPRVRLAAPILLVIIGIIASRFPFADHVEIDPELILVVLLPPLLYAASRSMPTTEFRREFATVSALAIMLVVITALMLGVFLSWTLPGIDLWWGIALGAVISPTDAAATAIARKARVSGRVVSILEGESLLNDATALVLLRSAIAAAAVSISVWSTVGTFLRSAIIATIIGAVVGLVVLRIRRRISSPALSTVWSFTVPFLASVPAERLEASGLVAAVVAGLITSRGALTWLDAEERTSDTMTWRSVEVVLEGVIFLTMGLQLTTLIGHVQDEHDSIHIAVYAGLAALLITLLVRALFLVPLLRLLERRRRRVEGIRTAFSEQRDRVIAEHDARTRWEEMKLAPDFEKRANRFRRFFADLEYYISQPLGAHAGVVLVWAGMRGAVTLAAAQTLPLDAPHRSLLIMIAFVAATVSLLVQGLTLPLVVTRFVSPPDGDRTIEQRRILHDALEAAADAVGPRDRDVNRSIARESAQYAELRRLRDQGSIDAEVLEEALATLDAAQITRLTIMRGRDLL